jgi:thiamine-phosphate pyrophosphorylase
MTSRPNKVEPRPQPRLYLVTPPVEDATAFAAQLATALAAGDIAAVLLRLAPADEHALTDRAKALVAVAQMRDVALLLDGHSELVGRAGADGAHLTGMVEFGEASSRLKPARIAGAGGLDTRHDAGADYVMFGEPDGGERPAFEAIEERVAWWAEVFEAPCVAFAASADEVEALVKAGADFIAIGYSFDDWIWRDPQAIAASIAEAARRLHVPETAA